jgi:ATP-dependent Zn protease
MNYIVTKPTKSKGIAILLTLLFGPIGLFYSSIRGGLIMTITPFIAGAIFIMSIFTGNIELLLTSYSFLIVFGLTWWIVCIIWAVNAVDKYNEKIESESYYSERQNTYDQKNDVNNRNNFSDSSSESFIEWSKRNPHKSLNDFYQENNNRKLHSRTQTTTNAYETENTDYQLIIYWIMAILFISGLFFMYNTNDHSFNLSNLLRFFN